jgi:glucose-6-phosphate 1-dehydrogenase
MNDAQQNKSHVSPPCILVIFGAAGDLTKRKLIPALYNLRKNNLLPDQFAVVGVARAEMNDEEFRRRLSDDLHEFATEKVDPAALEWLAQRLFYRSGDFDDDSTFAELKNTLTKLDEERRTGGNYCFYLATAPQYFAKVVEKLGAGGLTDEDEDHWRRVIIEKPFGTDLASARELNRVVSGAFDESQTYRIDHFLGKETAQNILVLRFANAIFEPLWNTRYIDHLEITAAETLGVESRAGYYETAGALRDMVQNHLLQLLCLVAMEAPTDLSADSIRDEKVKVVRALRRITGAEVPKNVVRAQYTEGAIGGQPVPGYRQEKGVDPKSMIETYVALRIHIDNWRWADVPVYMRVGKRLPKSATEISVHFKKAPAVLFNKETVKIDQNVLVIRIQPDEGISLRMLAKIPGTSLRIEPVKMDFHYGTSFGKPSPEAYERLLLDAMSGDPTLFARRDEVEEAWSFIDPIEEVWHAKKDAPELYFYPAGSWGPEAADDLLARDARQWRRL